MTTLPVLYEDADIVAVNKPAGLVTHAAGTLRSLGEEGQKLEPTAEDWFKEKYPEALLERPYVHRLDRDTSGVLVFAKNEAAHEFLRKAFTDREVQKTYLALVYGVPKEKKGVIEFAIGRSRKDFRLRSAQPKAKGRLREAITHYEVIGEAEEGSERYALLKVEPETGRTHQIRVHLKAIHHPIVGDKLYGPHSVRALGSHPIGIDRLALHAAEIDLPLPSGTRVHIEAPLPPELASIFALFPNAC